jgi:streptogramin lyase
MSLRPPIELLVVALLLAFLAVGFRVLTNPGKYFPEATPHAGQAFTEMVLVAGPTGVRGKRDARGEDAQFNAPRAMAFDRAGSLYVLDTGNHALRKLAPDGTVSTLADLSGDLGPQQGDYPDGIAVDSKGNVFIAEAVGQTIVRISPNGDRTSFAGLRGVAGAQDGNGITAGFAGPSGLVVDKADNLYVADSGNNAIRKISPAGVVTTLAGGSKGTEDGPLASARFSGPWGLAMDAAGTLYVAEMSRAEKDGRMQVATAIRRISSDGKVTTIAENALRAVPAGARKNIIQLNAATAIALDSQGALYYLAQGNIQRLPLTGPGGESLLAPATSTVHPAPLALAGLAIDSNNNVFVADAENDYVVKVTPQKDFSVFAGSSQFIGAPGKQEAIAGLDVPLLARTDAAGTIFVLYDGPTRHVRKLTADYQISAPLNRLVDDGKVKSSLPPQPAGHPMAPGTARLFRAAALEQAAGFHFLSFDKPEDGSFTINPANNTFAVDAQDNIYLPSQCGEKNVSCVVKITPAGQASVFSSGYTNAQDIQTDSKGYVYVYDAISSKQRTGKQWQDQLVVLRPDGALDHAFSLDMPEIPNPEGKAKKAKVPARETTLAVAANGDIFVADLFSVRKISAQGTVSTVAGNIEESGYLDAKGEKARFDHINGLVFGDKGFVYVSEGGSNNALRQIGPDGLVSTVINPKGQGIIHYDPATVGELSQVRGIAPLPEGKLVLLNRFTVLRAQ